MSVPIDFFWGCVVPLMGLIIFCVFMRIKTWLTETKRYGETYPRNDINHPPLL